MRARVERLRPDLLELAEAEVPRAVRPRRGRTRFAQPAIYCASLAGCALCEATRPHLHAGHSMGEIAALAAAGALSDEDGLRLVAVRGRLMDEAADDGARGGMLAVLGCG